MGLARQLDGICGMASRMMAAGSLGLAAASPLAAQPIEMLDIARGDPWPNRAVVVDIRAEDVCLDASLAGARCLPAEWFLSADGAAIGFHAMRWLMGTVGLTGSETLVIYDGAARPGDAAWAIAALAHLAGQQTVLLHMGPGVVKDTGGEGRSLSREAVYTAPMRTDEMTVTSKAAGTLRDRLIGFARAGGVVVFTPET